MTGKQTTDALNNQWHKICGIVMHMLGERHVVITPADIEDVSNGINVVAQELDEGLHIRLMTDAEVDVYRKRGIDVHDASK